MSISSAANKGMADIAAHRKGKDYQGEFFPLVMKGLISELLINQNSSHERTSSSPTSRSKS